MARRPCRSLDSARVTKPHSACAASCLLHTTRPPCPCPSRPPSDADLLGRAPTSNPRPPPRPARAPAAPGRAAEPVARRSLELSNDGEPPAGRRRPPRGRRLTAGADAARRRRRTTQRAPSASASARPRGNGPATLFVLDTNVLMHDPTSLFRFEEHDVYLPMITLEELDGHKRGMTEVARNARQVSRDLDALAASMPTRNARAERRHRPRQDRPARGRRQAVLPDHADRRHAAGRPAAGQGRQPDPRRRQGAARAAAGTRRRAGVQGHQHAHQGARAGPAGRGLLQRQDARRRRPALHRRAAAAGRLLGHARQDDGELAAGRPHLLPHHRPAGAGAADQPVRLPRAAGRRLALRAR